jgi:transmembrane sensor
MTINTGMNKKDIYQNLLKFIDGEQITDDEKAEIKEWIDSNRENKDCVEMIKEISREKRFLDKLKNVDLDKNWERFKDSVNRNTGQARDYSFVRRKRLYLSRIAAVILLLILAGSAIYLAKRKDVYHVRQVSSIHEKTKVKLSDGTTILLNKGSLLSYPEHINRRIREVKLAGDAYFEVVKNDASPFFVYVKNTTIKVLGTSFNIKEDKGGTVEVYVLTGKVSFFETGKRSNSLELEAGQMGVFNITSKKFEQSSFNTENFLFWMEGNLSFIDQPLDIVFQNLEKNFGTRILVEDSDILQYRFTSYCEGQQLDDILNELSILFNIRYYKRGNTIYIQKSH